MCKVKVIKLSLKESNRKIDKQLNRKATYVLKCYYPISSYPFIKIKYTFI